MKAAIYSEPRLQQIIGEMRRAFKRTGYLRVSYSEEKGRSVSQNALAHVWYEQISREIGEDTPEGVKAECKLRFGVPILRAQDEDFRARYDAAIRKNLTYEQKLQVMRLLPVTSLMSVSQLSQYLQDIQMSYAGRVDLRFPDELADAA